MNESRQLGRTALEAEWLDLVRRRLPALADERDWPIRLDHCFARVLLDNAVGGCWYDFISGRPAYRQASDAQLGEAVALGLAAEAGGFDLPAANARSLRWRGKEGAH
ncbi:GCN5-related N-acetyltransferase [Croceibacterium sp. TMG7-5b_MA50]|uniref:GCN5-related N-acetyltransferase n=1 Tax=Croceibacterium sp. TMG7-5b_MA50 TaxID=3121290 RepID=UPI00322208DC